MHYTPVNTGSVAMAESAIRSIREQYPKAEIYIGSDYLQMSREMFPHVHVVRKVFDPSGVVFTKKTLSLEFLFKNYKFILRVIIMFLLSLFCAVTKIKTTPSKSLNALVQADLVLSLAGDAISQDYAYTLRFYEFWLLKKLRIPNILYAQSVGPFDGKARQQAQFGLNQVTAIIARDNRTIDLMKKYEIEVPVIKSTDSAICLPTVVNSENEKVVTDLGLQKDKYVGIVIRGLKFTEYGEEEYQRYEQGMHDVLQYLTKKKYKILFTPTIVADYDSIVDFQKKYDFNFPIIKLYEYKPSEVKGILQNLYSLISPRMHPVILSSSSDQNVPVIGLGREFKMKEYLEMAGLGDNFLPMIPFDKDKVISVFENVEKNYEPLKEKVSRDVSRMRESSLNNIKLVDKIYKKYPSRYE